MYEGTFARVSNRATWNDTVEVRDDNTDELFDLSEVDEITLQLCHRRPDDYGWSGSSVLSATLTGGDIVITDLGTFEFTFNNGTMSGICASTYDIGLILQIDETVTQLVIGSVAVIDGVVR